jgi:hypothetical protein
MTTRTWGIAMLSALGVSGCGSENPGCTANGQALKSQILAQRDSDFASGSFQSATVNPCNLQPDELAFLQTRNPVRPSEYDSACKKMAANGCSITDAEAAR